MDEAWSDGTDGRLGFWNTPGAALRAAGFVGLRVILLPLCLLACQIFASTPPNHGELTVAQFAENYNHLNRFSSAPETPAYHLNDQGQWEKRQVGQVIIELYDDTLADMQYETDQGHITPGRLLPVLPAAGAYHRPAHLSAGFIVSALLEGSSRLPR